MKIGDHSSRILMDSADLFSRMEQARDAEVGEAGKASAEPVEKSALAAPNSAPAQASGELEGALQGQLLEAAASALRGEFSSENELRGHIIELILAERYAPAVGPAERREITQSLQILLNEDPQFIRQVDQMLLNAARLLARGRPSTA